MEHRTKNAALAIIIASYMMIILDTSIVITGLRYIRTDIGLSTLALSWVQSIYTLFFGGCLLLGARVGDLLGGKRALLWGLYLFMAMSLLIAVAQTPFWLLFARAAQGLGAALIAPSALMLLSANFAEGEERTRALSWYGSTAGVGASIGLLVGGVLADALSWRAGFLLNLPVGALLAVSARRYLLETTPRPHRLDVPGAVLSTLGIGAIIYGVMQSSHAGWGSTATLLPLLGGAVLVALFIWHEARTPHPLLPLRVLCHRRRAGAYIVRFLFLGPMVGFFFFSSQYLQGVFGYSALGAGVGFLPMTLFAFGVALCVPRLARVVSHRRLMVAGLASVTLGLFWLSVAPATQGYWLAVALPMVLIGAGQGLCLPPMTAAGIAGAEPEDAGAASGVVNVAHQLGASFGLGLLASLAAVAEQGYPEGVVALTHGCQMAFLSGGVMMLMATAVAASVVR